MNKIEICARTDTIERSERRRPFERRFSVFECEVDPAQWAMLRARLIGEINPDKDSLRFYFLGSNCRVEHVGAKPSVDFDAPMII